MPAKGLAMIDESTARTTNGDEALHQSDPTIRSKMRLSLQHIICMWPIGKKDSKSGRTKNDDPQTLKSKICGISGPCGTKLGLSDLRIEFLWDHTRTETSASWVP